MLPKKSGADADLWTRLLCSKQFKKKPSELCAAIADVAKKLNTEIVNPQHLRGLVAGRLIPLDKNPGVRPIGIGEVLHRIIARATTTVPQYMLCGKFMKILTQKQFF